MRQLPVSRVSKSVPGPRSVENAMVFPSGDQTGWNSAFLSSVSRRRFSPSRSTMKRSESPPTYPVKTSRVPSGLHDGVVMPSSSGLIRPTWRFRATSRMRISSLRPRLPATAMNRPSGEKLAAELMKRNVS